VPRRCARRRLATQSQVAGFLTSAATPIPSPPVCARRRVGWESRAVPGEQRSARTEPAPRRWQRTAPRSIPPSAPAHQRPTNTAPRHRHLAWPLAPQSACLCGWAWNRSRTAASGTSASRPTRPPPRRRVRPPVEGSGPCRARSWRRRPARRRCSSETSSRAHSSPADSAARPQTVRQGKARTLPPIRRRGGRRAQPVSPGPGGTASRSIRPRRLGRWSARRRSPRIREAGHSCPLGWRRDSQGSPWSRPEVRSPTAGNAIARHANQDVCSVRGVQCAAGDLGEVGHALEQRS